MGSARFFALALALAAFVAIALGASPASSDTAPLTNPKHFFWAPGQNPDRNGLARNDLIYHGGNAGPGAIGVETKPAVYLVYWGPHGHPASRPPTATASSTRARRSRTT